MQTAVLLHMQLIDRQADKWKHELLSTTQYDYSATAMLLGTEVSM